MKRYGASAALALMFGGTAAVIAGCPGYTFEPRPFNVGGAAGAAGTAGSGGSGGGGTVLCGNGIVDADAAEACDDGSTKDGDGCSADCKVEECWQCPTDGGTCEHRPEKAGCGMGETNFCNMGQCVQCIDSVDCGGMPAYCHMNICYKCNDDMMNGDEAATDCGGANCNKCANGTPCSGIDPGNCESGKCVDGYCCNSFCIATICKTCALPGSEGTCSDVPVGIDDNNPSCGAMKVCGLPGDACQGVPGAKCGQDSDCLSNSCMGSSGNKTCRKGATGTPCSANSHCTSDNCDLIMRKCVP